ncbi:MAG: mevalonate kinase [Deltaproteobacteria bacterium]|nr:mevalonate kinase [Deltaproteobacteria bacterium]
MSSGTGTRAGVGTGRAGGKVILLGEHAVVHGTAALAMAFPRGVSVTARESDGPVALEARAWRYRVAADDGSPGGEALRALVAALGVAPCGIALEADVRIPDRAGLGSSAAMAAASARAIASLLAIPFDDDRLFAAVQASETVFHGNPSGLDATMALFGGVVRYTRAGGATRLRAPGPQVVVASSGEPGRTGETVAAFARRLAAEPVEGRRRLAALGDLVESGTAALVRGDLAALGRTMDEDQEHLSWFGVSTSRLDRICEVARRAGALGAKLTGGGGGGCAVALVQPGDDAVAPALCDAGFEVVS